MDSKILQLISISAKDLKNVSLRGTLNPYVKVYLSDEPKNKQRTLVNHDAGTSPTWDSPMMFATTGNWALQYVVFKIKHSSVINQECLIRSVPLGIKRHIGEARVPLKDLVAKVADAKEDSAGPFTATYPIRSASSGKENGEFIMTYKVFDNPQPLADQATQKQNIGMGWVSGIAQAAAGAATAQVVGHLFDGHGDAYSGG